MMKSVFLSFAFIVCGVGFVNAALPSFPVTPEWEAGLRTRAPESPPAAPAEKRKLLVFSLATGFKHWCIPHTEAMVRILGEKSGAYEITATRDIEDFRAENLARYDAVVMNNTCPHRKDRDGFRDVLINEVEKFGAKYKDLPLEEREALAGTLYRNLVDYVSGGGGLVLLHGGITSFNYSDEFSGIVGGSFDFHPVQQDVTLLPVDPAHPLLKPFDGKPLVHHDEPYFFNRAYPKLNFRPLLEMDMAKLKHDKRVSERPVMPRYVSWIKRYHKGRIFFCSPSHNAQSFEHAELLAFILGGIQYAVGDLACDDKPVGEDDFPVPAVKAVSAGPKPNIVLIMIDDMGWADVGYHSDEIRSPNLDRLAATGIELDQHYVMPQCTPTRVALMTGRYPSRFGGHCTTASNLQSYPLGTVTLASALRSAGYDTALTGKWHMGSLPEAGPRQFGFNHTHGSFAGAVGMFDHRYRLNLKAYTRTWHRNDEFIEQEGHAYDLCTDEAVKWIENELQPPFFLYVPYHGVHTPLVESEERIAAQTQTTGDRRIMAAAVEHLDEQIGRIVEVLDRKKLRDNTLIIIFSDNGGFPNYRGGNYPAPDMALENFSSNHPLRGQKMQVFEGGIRVPALANWPGRLKPGKVTAPMHAVDWMPTLLELAGVEHKQDDGDGRDIWPLLLGKQAADPERVFYWIWGRGGRVALRQGDWKLVRDGGKEFMLFNLADDPVEKHDLAGQYPEKVQELMSLLDEQQTQDAKGKAAWLK